MDSVDREKQIILSLKSRARTSEVGQLVIELCSIRLERSKNDLVKEENSVVRGRAQELRDLHKILTEVEGV